MRYIYLFSIIIAFSSCSQKEEASINMEDIMPKANYDKEKKIVVEEKKVSYQPEIDSKTLEEVGIVWDSVSINEDQTIPERFSPLKTEKFDYFIEGKTTHYSRWTFKDSTKSMSAFLNWMNCYGDRCKMIELRKKENIQRDAVIILQNDTCMIQIQSSMMGLNELKKWKKIYLSNEKAKWNFIIHQNKGSKAQWSNFGNKLETDITLSSTKEE